jgi:hypothetical protein
LRQRKDGAAPQADDAIEPLPFKETTMKLSIAAATLAAALFGATGTLALAQGSASAPAPGARPASGPMMGMPGSGMGGMQGMRGWRANRDNTPGWAMMNRAERDEHHRKMQSMTSADECKTYMDKHRAEMVERAKQRGRTAPGAVAPRHDPCARLTPGK